MSSSATTLQKLEPFHCPRKRHAHGRQACKKLVKLRARQREYISFLLIAKNCGLAANEQYHRLRQGGMKLGRTTFRKLRRGVPGDQEALSDFADGLKLNAVDRVELLILHGEAKLGDTAYDVDKRKRWKFVQDWNEDFNHVSEAPYQAGMIRGLPDFVEAQSNYRDLVDTGFAPVLRSLLAKRKLSIAIAAARTKVSRQHLSAFLNGRSLLSPRAFSTLCKILEPEDNITALLRSLYVNALGCDEVLGLSLSDLQYYYNPSRHRRLTNWLMALALNSPKGEIPPQASCCDSTPTQKSSKAPAELKLGVRMELDSCNGTLTGRQAILTQKVTPFRGASSTYTPMSLTSTITVVDPLDSEQQTDQTQFCKGDVFRQFATHRDMKYGARRELPKNGVETKRI